MYDKWATFSPVAVLPTERARWVAAIARNKSIPTVSLPKAAAAIMVVAAMWRLTATQSLDHATQMVCQLAGVRIVIIRLASVVIDLDEDDAMVAGEPQVAMMEQQSSLIQWIPVRDRRVATFIAVTP